MTENVVEYVRARLAELSEESLRTFMCRIIPTVDAESILGIRTPNMKAFASEFAKSGMTAEFSACLPHKYYEENCLHAFLLTKIKDFDCCVSSVEAFLPYIDNWAVCDTLRPPVFGKHTDELVPYIRRWLASAHSYTVRFGIEMLMNFYLDEHYLPEYPALVCGVDSEEYYVNMMRAWYFATALSKRFDELLPYLTECRLDKWTHNKTIQKAVESYRITAEQKAFLKTLKQK